MPNISDEYELLGKEARSIDNEELGKVQVEGDYILTQGDKLKFYIPTYLVEKSDRYTLWFRINEDEAKSKFMIAGQSSIGSEEISRSSDLQ